MIVEVLTYKVLSNYTGSWTSNTGIHTISTGNFLHVQVDDSSGALSVIYSSASDLNTGTVYGTLVNGPNLFFGNGGSVQLLTTLNYQWCSGTTLKKTGNINAFPYAFISSYPDAIECIIVVPPVCDLEISSLYTLTPTSDPAVPDGAFSGTATSSNGEIRYAIDDPNFDYGTASNVLLFTGLYSGQHTIYAKDAVGCLDSITFKIPVTTLYGVKHRLEFTDSLAISSKFHRVDILERAYTGPILEMCGSGKPIVVRYEGDRDDPNVEIVAGHAILEILVETEGQYTHLHTADDRKYKLIYYTGDDASTPDIYFIGYDVPEYHAEPYLTPPYYFTCKFSDQLGELKNKDFLDIGGNKFRGDLKLIKVVAEILKKTGLELNIRCAINVFEERMLQGPTDDPLDQAYADSRIYYDKETNCADALRSITLSESLRCQVVQSMGFWWIRRLSEAAAPYEYRDFDFNGDILTNGIFDPIIELSFPTDPSVDVMFANASQFLAYVQNFGKFIIDNDLRKDGNLIDEGRFEEEDIINLGSGNVTFKNWNYSIGQPGAVAGFEAVLNGDSKGAAFLDFTLANQPQNDSTWYSVVIPMDDYGAFKFKFQYFVSPKYDVPWIRIAWALKFTLDPTSGTDPLWVSIRNGIVNFTDVETRNEIYVEKFNEWQTFEITAPVSPNFITDSVQIFLYAHNHYGRDFDGFDALHVYNLHSDPHALGLRRLMVDNDFDAGHVITYFYKVVLGNQADTYFTGPGGAPTPTSTPDIIRPTSYSAPSGLGRDYLWQLEDALLIGQNETLVNRIKFDNVSLAFYPAESGNQTKFIDPPEILSYTKTVSEFVESVFTKEVLLGDMIRFNQERTANEKNIYRSYLRFADGTPTRFWNRKGLTETKNILQILLDDYVNQFSLPQRKLSGVKITTSVMHFINALRDNIDARIYLPMTFEFDAKNAMYTPDMSAVAVGGDGGQVNLGDFDPADFDSADFLTGT